MNTDKDEETEVNVEWQWGNAQKFLLNLNTTNSKSKIA